MQKENKLNVLDSVLKQPAADKAKTNTQKLDAKTSLGAEPKTAAGLAGVDQNLSQGFESAIKPQLQQMVEKVGLSKADAIEFLKSCATGLAQGTVAGLKSKPDAFARTMGLGGQEQAPQQGNSDLLNAISQAMVGRSLVEKEKPLVETALPTGLALFGNLVLASHIEQGGLQLMESIRSRGLNKVQASDSKFAQTAQKALNAAHQSSIQVQTAIANAKSVLPPVALERISLLKGVGKFMFGVSPLGRLANMYTVYDIAKSTGAIDKVKDGTVNMWNNANTFATELYSPHRDYFSRLGSEFNAFTIAERNFRNGSPIE